VLAVAAAFNLNVQTGSVPLSVLTLDNVEALAGGEASCTSTSGTNTGKCKKRKDGTGDACVESAWYESNNCYK